MSKLKDELVEMQKQRDAAIAIWLDLDKELKDIRKTIGMTNHIGVPSMTLRDYFAGQALCGIMVEGTSAAVTRWVGNVAYETADQMIRARNNRFVEDEEVAK